jgi:hypothetical protein
MLDTQSLQWLMACERLKDEVSTVEQQCAVIVHSFDALEREPTMDERDSRRQAYLENRARLATLHGEIEAISQRLRAHH